MRAGIVWLVLLAAAAALCPGAAAQHLKDLYQKTNPSVGTVSTVERTPAPNEPGHSVKRTSLGSGVLISAGGKMITAAHVVHNADNVIVQFSNGERTPARVVASSPHADVALLQLETQPEGVVPAVLGDSDQASVGDQVFIIGAPYGIGHSMTVGHISGRHQPGVVVRDFELGEFFQTDAAVNQGNSGGPMFNMEGEVIGIVSSILSRSGGFEGVGFAATSNTARKLLLDEPTPWSGVEFYPLSGDLARAFNVPQSEGMLVERVAVGSVGFEMGLKGGKIIAVIEDRAVLIGGDVVLAVQDIQVSSRPEVIESIRKAIGKTAVGQEIRVKVLRAGEIVELSAAREH